MIYILLIVQGIDLQALSILGRITRHSAKGWYALRRPISLDNDPHSGWLNVLPKRLQSYLGLHSCRRHRELAIEA
jgi:hypothetical protein